jgi:hypothetical protein
MQRAQLHPRLPPERVHVPLHDRPLRLVRPLPEPDRARGRLLLNHHRLRRLCHRSECDGARDPEKHTAPADPLVLAIHPLELPIAEQRSPGPETVQLNFIPQPPLGGPDIDEILKRQNEEFMKDIASRTLAPTSTNS